MKKIYILIITILILSAFDNLHSRIAIVIGKNATHTLDNNDLKKIFLGEVQNWNSGELILTVNQHSSITGSSFCNNFLNIAPEILYQRWSKLIFSGLIKKPINCENDDQVKIEVNKNKNRIGYIDASKVDDTIKVLRYIN